MFLKSEARSFKEKAKLFMPPRTLEPSSRIALSISVHARWINKNGSFRKLDIQNLEKILIDAIADKYDFDDSRVWQKFCNKIESDKDEVRVILSEIA